MRRRSTFIAIMLAAVLAQGCDSEPTEVPASTFCSDDAYDDEDVIVEGTLVMPDMFVSLTGQIDLRLQTDERTIFFAVYEGAGPNRIAPLPASYTDADLVIHGADGRDLRVGDRVRVTGEVYLPNHPGCGVRVRDDDHTIVAAP